MIKAWRVRLAGQVACMGELRNGYKVLVGKPEGKTCTNSWEDCIKMSSKKK
jgi:hypothetical protein